MTIKRRIVTVFLAFALALSLIPFLPAGDLAGNAYAIPYYAVDFNEGTYTVDESFPYRDLYIDCGQRLDTFYGDSTDPDVVEIAQVYDTGIRVRPCGIGTSTVSLYDGNLPEDSEHWFKIDITVTKEGMMKAAGNAAYIDDQSLGYGTDKLLLNGYGGTRFNITINGKSFDEVYFETAGEQTLKLPKVYKVGTKIICERTYDYIDDEDYTKNVSLPTETYKINKQSYVTQAKLATGGKKIRISLENVHKGDVFNLYYKGKTYTKKITKNYPKDDGEYAFVIRLKDKMYKNSAFKAKITNKYKQVLYNRKITLKDGKFWLYGDD